MNSFHADPQTKLILPSAESVLRDDVPLCFEQVDLLLQNAPVLIQNCPSVPLVMEDL